MAAIEAGDGGGRVRPKKNCTGSPGTMCTRRKTTTRIPKNVNTAFSRRRTRYVSMERSVQLAVGSLPTVNCQLPTSQCRSCVRWSRGIHHVNGPGYQLNKPHPLLSCTPRTCLFIAHLTETFTSHVYGWSSAS